MTKEDEKATIGALLEERRGYELRKTLGEEQATSDDPVEAAAGKEIASEMSERLKTIDGRLKDLGHGAQKHSSRAEKRPSQRKSAGSKR